MKKVNNKTQKSEKKMVSDIVIPCHDRAEYDFYVTPAVGWHIGIYEMPQCTARGTPIM